MTEADQTQRTPPAPQPGTREPAGDDFGVASPTIDTPTGGGAIRGIGETFSTNPMTGTASMSVPIATSPGRSGVGPTLTLTYDSGAGNGPFGLAWGSQPPSVTRSTRKARPRYLDTEDSDDFVLSGAEDLVPVLEQDASTGEWRREEPRARRVHDREYRIARYRPRTEGLFARIERWTNTADASDVFWRSISRDNVTSWYGRTANSRIVDPSDPRRIYSWLLGETYDDKGNVTVYGYKNEDSARIFDDASGRRVPKAHERNRTDESRAAQRYPKRIRYGNRTPYFPRLTEGDPWPEPPDAAAADASDAWLFEVVFDYGEHDQDSPTPREDRDWPCRQDPFSTYHAGFEIRTYRTCQRVLMFHHFPDEPGVGRDCLVRSTDFTYSDELDPASARNPVYTYLRSVTHTGYRRDGTGYLHRSLPPVDFEYSQPALHTVVEDVAQEVLDNPPVSVEGDTFRWADLYGEGLTGLLTEHAGAWYYQHNLSPAPTRHPDGTAKVAARLGARQTVTAAPNAPLAGVELTDLANDGQLDIVVRDGPGQGFYERDPADGWRAHRPLRSPLTHDLHDQDLRLVDVTGDGHADVLIAGESLVWIPSQAEDGFGAASRITQALDEEEGPRVVFSDASEAVVLAHLSGGAGRDIARITNAGVSYWPNLGYGRFGPKVTMDNAPWFDHPDQFDATRILLGDVDGSGTTDILYRDGEGVLLAYNQSGNSLSTPQRLDGFPRLDDRATVTVMDLLGVGTACLVWSTALPGTAGRELRYLDLMGGTKPHLLVRTANNLGAETRIHYAPSTKFYLQDKQAGRPWVTRLPFPVHVVEKVETYDHISRNRVTSRSVFHHGFYDPAEKEFRGFALVEQWDSEQIGALSDGRPLADNESPQFHTPPVLTKTFLHTGAYIGRDHVSNFLAGLGESGASEYYREPGLSDADADALLLADTILPDGLTAEEEREACRALRGSVLRQEVYAQDHTATPDYPHGHPYTVTESNYTVRLLQPRAGNRHAVFHTHPRESLSYHYERDPADPRIGHTLTLQVDDYGNTLKAATVGYGRRQPDPGLEPRDQATQARTLITYTENAVTNAIDAEDQHRNPLPSESRTYELTGVLTFQHDYPTALATHFRPSGRNRYSLQELRDAADDATGIGYEQEPTGRLEKRLIEHTRTYYRADPLTGSLPLGELQALALPHEAYRLALTPALVTSIYDDRVTDDMLEEGGYVHLDGDDNWWVPSGRVFYTPDPGASPAEELAEARAHFFLPRRFRDPFHTDAVSTESFVTYDDYDLLLHETRDALENRVTVGERHPDPDRPIVRKGQDYRVLQPWMVMDPNRNRTEVAYDALGMVVGTAVMGKPPPAPVEGDSLDGFVTDLGQDDIDRYLDDPRGPLAAQLLKDATTRVVYDLTPYARADDPTSRTPAVAVTLARETHVSDLSGTPTKIQVGLAYSDGYGRVIQEKTQAAPGPAPQRDADGAIILGPTGQPVMTSHNVAPRWIGSGWTVFDAKGNPRLKYENFFADSHRFDADTKIGVSSLLAYDPLGRQVATLHPNHSWEKEVVTPWTRETWDANDTVLIADPASDRDVGDHFRRLDDDRYLPTWYALRTDGAYAEGLSLAYPDLGDQHQETRAAEKTSIHAATPAIGRTDSLGRAVLTVAHNKARYSTSDLAEPPVEAFHTTRVTLDIQGNMRSVIDAKDRLAVRYGYDLRGDQVKQESMEAGPRIALSDVAETDIYSWDGRNTRLHYIYDPLRRLAATVLAEAGGTPTVERRVYGEERAGSEASNQRGRVIQLCDQAGAAESELYDFRGNLIRRSVRTGKDHSALLDWSGSPDLDRAYVTLTRHDALNRLVQVITPHAGIQGESGNAIQTLYDDGGLARQVDVWLDLTTNPSRVLDPRSADLHAVVDIRYNSRGQREEMTYGNGVKVSYSYDQQTFRRMRVVARGPGVLPETIQYSRYVYDPSGNLSHVSDAAQQTIFFRNRHVEPTTDYTYDATYRLIEATGREHVGQPGGDPIPHSYGDSVRVGIPHPADGRAMARYVERYIHDEVGNLVQIRHRGSDPSRPGWSREYVYVEASHLESTETNNALTACVVNGVSEEFSQDRRGYDGNGNMVGMPHLSAMKWDYRNQLEMTQRQALGGGDIEGLERHGERTWYRYDSGGERVRLVTEWPDSRGIKEERIYLGSLQIYRRAAATSLVRQTLVVTIDGETVASVDTRVGGDELGVPRQQTIFHLSDHQSSVTVDVNDAAVPRIVSYEEYTPYGATAYQSRASSRLKRYRYNAKERDEASGLYYYGARYYAPWVGRWISPDPAGLSEGPNLYEFARSNPVRYIDRNGMQSDDEAKGPTMRRRTTTAVRQTVGASRRSASLPTRATIAILLSAGTPASSQIDLENPSAGADVPTEELESDALTRRENERRRNEERSERERQNSEDQRRRQQENRERNRPWRQERNRHQQRRNRMDRRRGGSRGGFARIGPLVFLVVSVGSTVALLSTAEDPDDLLDMLTALAAEEAAMAGTSAIIAKVFRVSATRAGAVSLLLGLPGDIPDPDIAEREEQDRIIHDFLEEHLPEEVSHEGWVWLTGRHTHGQIGEDVREALFGDVERFSIEEAQEVVRQMRGE